MQRSTNHNQRTKRSEGSSATAADRRAAKDGGIRKGKGRGRTASSKPRRSVAAMGALNTFREQCPRCEGLLPSEAISIGQWRQVNESGVTFMRRIVQMLCPHCGYRERNKQEQPLN